MRRILGIVFLLAVVLWAAYGMFAPHSQTKQIRIVGSATVYPFVTAAAEMFGLNGKYPAPIVEATGTGGGFKIFCEGAGEDTPDINDASREILPSESELCKKNGVKVQEIALGYDGITLSGSIDGPLFRLTLKQLFLALVRQVPGKAGLVDNPYRLWSDIDPALPKTPILVYGPPPTSGTRDAFTELVMEKTCAAFSGYAQAYPEKSARLRACRSLREDGAYIEAGENGNLVIQKLRASPETLGIVGYSFLEENTDKVRAAPIEGVAPTPQAISSGQYPLSRKLYIYVKREHIGQTPGLAEFAGELVSEAANGPEGYLTDRGLLPLLKEERERMREQVKSL